MDFRPCGSAPRDTPSSDRGSAPRWHHGRWQRRGRPRHGSRRLFTSGNRSTGRSPWGRSDAPSVIFNWFFHSKLKNSPWAAVSRETRPRTTAGLGGVWPSADGAANRGAWSSFQQPRLGGEGQRCNRLPPEESLKASTIRGPKKCENAKNLIDMTRPHGVKKATYSWRRSDNWE
jgi:hypothetical protein